MFDRLGFAVLIATSALAGSAGCVDQSVPRRGTRPFILAAARAAFERAHRDGPARQPQGPCIADDLFGSEATGDSLPKWSVDIVHVPRQAVDDLPSNQCRSFLRGRTKHLVELDEHGKVVAVRWAELRTPL